jgi:hypothetical protein
MAAPIYKGGTPFISSGIRGKCPVTASSSAAVTLKRSQSNGAFLFDRASGTSYTLPSPVAGLCYTFYVSVLQTSGANVVVTNAATVFLTGVVQMFSGEAVTPSATLGPFQFAGNGTTHIKTTTNGTTTGGGVGSWMTYHCISSTLWMVTGLLKSPSGNLATPFST